MGKNKNYSPDKIYTRDEFAKIAQERGWTVDKNRGKGSHWWFSKNGESSFPVLGKIKTGLQEQIKKWLGDFKVVISEPFHMSFPNVFNWNDNYYMIPETHQKNQIRLYKCLEFPYKWELDKVLAEGVKLVDHALYLDGDEIIMITYDAHDINNKKSVFYKIDMRTKTAQPLNMTGNFSNERPGGTVFKSNGKLYRAIQDCERIYGDFLKIYEIDKISDNELEEHLVKTLHADDFNFDVNKKIERCHTYNQSKRYEVMDFNCEKFYPNKFIMRLWQRIIRKDRRGH